MKLRYVAFLRGINLGRRRIKMSDLQSLFDKLGFSGVETFIASGNVIFKTSSADAAKLEQRIEKRLEASLGYSVETFIRTGPQVASILRFEPFPAEDPGNNTLHVGFLRDALSRDEAQKLVACRTQHDEFRVKGREFYWLCRIRTSESKVWTSSKMKAIEMPSCTMRNLTTIQRLAAKHGL